jgi:RNA polymerase sigma factor (sigma-70 family)
MAIGRINSLAGQLRRVLILQDGMAMTDAQLLDRFISRRDEVAAEALVQKYGPMVWGVCQRTLRNHQDAEDAFQATFLVFTKKASSVSPREMIGNWLYGVACHVALKAMAAGAKRRSRERVMEPIPECVVHMEDCRSDLKPVLDRELSRLPQKYSAPVVLCDLQGLTQKEAAQQLGWPIGTLSCRLSRARAILAKRLARHGVALSSAGLAIVVSDCAVACVPLQLMTATVKASRLLLEGQCESLTLIAANVLNLTDKVVGAMFVKRVKRRVAAVLFVLSLFAVGGGLLVCNVLGGQETAEDSPHASGLNKARNAPQLKQSKESNPAVVQTHPLDIAKAYRTNAALADELYTDKRVVVSGRMVRISKLPADNMFSKQSTYLLQMDSGQSGSKTTVYFLFPISDANRKGLASLKEDAMVAIDGQCKGVIEVHTGGPENGEMLYFEDSKIVEKGP